jgi:uncharacterized protein YecE (DUF72 family)
MPLGPRLGVVLFQLPPFFRRTSEARRVPSRAPGRPPYAMGSARLLERPRVASVSEPRVALAAAEIGSPRLGRR